MLATARGRAGRATPGPATGIGASAAVLDTTASGAGMRRSTGPAPSAASGNATSCRRAGDTAGCVAWTADPAGAVGSPGAADVVVDRRTVSGVAGATGSAELAGGGATATAGAVAAGADHVGAPAVAADGDAVGAGVDSPAAPTGGRTCARRCAVTACTGSAARVARRSGRTGPPAAGAAAAPSTSDVGAPAAESAAAGAAAVKPAAAGDTAPCARMER
jgi:hypothetical protein